MGNWGNSSNRGSSIGETSKELRISLGISLSLTLDNGVSNLLADLLIFNLLSVDSLRGAHILSSGGADLGDKNLLLSHTIGCREGHRGSMVGEGASKQLGVSLSISLRLRGSCSKGNQARNGKNLHLV